MSTVHIPDDLRQFIDRQVAEGHATSAAEFLEAAVRRYVVELESDDTALVAAAEQGLTALRSGDYATVDSPQGRHAFWESVSNDASVRLAELRDAATDDGAKNHSQAESGPE